MAISQWPVLWEALSEACQLHGATGRRSLKGNESSPMFQVSAPASPKDIANIEQRIGLRLPNSLMQVLINFSSQVGIEWQLPKGIKPPKPFNMISSGQCGWDLFSLPELYTTYQGWLHECFTTPDDPYDAVWYNKLPIFEIGNGDMVAIELGIADSQPVVYLSHDDGEGNGYWLGSDFEDYIDRLSLLGCPGAEDWQWMPFVNDPRSLLDPFGESAIQWRDWFGLSLLENY